MRATPFEVGKKYLVRTVTMYSVGEVVEVVGKFLVMKDASWISDTGTYSKCLKDSSVLREVEYLDTPKFFLNLDSIVDACEVFYCLPILTR